MKATDAGLRSIRLNRLAPLTGAKRYAAVLGSGYATFAFFYFVHPLSAVLWIALAATLYNGCASVLGAVPAMREPISEESVTPMVVATLSAVVTPNHGRDSPTRTTSTRASSS